jgi:Protein of unknown function (DUF1592)/Protein of unknown function (DUF1587)/Protein of unknown function (DUF1588)/Protein of unknown function (DUF1585)/Protein of unknown function (DUF1595)
VRIFLLIVSLVALAALAFAWAARRAPIESASIDIDIEGLEPDVGSTAQPTDAAAFLKRHCVDCHGAIKPRGGVTLTELPRGALVERAAEAIRGGRMPPASRPMPSTEVDGFLVWAEQSAPPVRVTLRRLNRSEYSRTLRDLLGVQGDFAADFPADDTGEGFDTLGDVLTLSPTLIERYLAAAEAAVDAARADPAAWHRLMNPLDDFMPFVLRGPPPERNPAVKGQHPAQGDVELGRAYRALQSFTDRAYRRPATHTELDRLMRFVAESRDGIEAGLQLAFRAVLISPHFLCKMEPNGPSELSDFEIAARLSYFLWSTMPDEELTRTAASGKLREPTVLVAQVRRMLRDPRARALAEDFGGQWLGTRALDGIKRLDSGLRFSLRREAEEFVAHVVQTDQSVLDFLHGEYTFIDARLARHYGIAGVEDDEFHRVSLEGRAGVTTLGGVLTVASGPVRRGRWLLDNILGAPPPPPPPGNDSLKDRAPTTTLRERLERHRRDPACASCHARMDPLGFALDGFDDQGRRREADDHATLPDGRELHGAFGLRTALAEKPDVFVTCLGRKLMVYGLGRSLGAADTRTVRRAVRHAGRNGYRFSSLVIALIRSEAFLSRSSEGASP